MAIVELTKAQVLAAIKREKLVSGAWAVPSDSFHVTSGRKANKYAKMSNVEACAVCAVGAVVRAAMIDTTYWEVNDLAARAVMRDRKFHRLSALFEGTANPINAGNSVREAKANLEKARKKALAFVRKNFPAKVRIDLGGVPPRRGMKVITPKQK